jgi:hypothetical protein
VILRQLAQRDVAPPTAALLACGLALLAAGGDWITGADAAFTLFYVLPIALAVWFTASAFPLTRCRVSSTRSPRMKGIGDGARLGLSVSYQIVEEHGGWITVDTRLGKGTSFHVHLPV